MAKASKSKSTSKNTSTPAKKAAAPSRATSVRNTALPRKVAAKAAPTYDQIARRAYEIYASGNGGSEQENWHRAERELRGV